jgi:hypothetical protein
MESRAKVLRWEEFGRSQDIGRSGWLEWGVQEEGGDEVRGAGAFGVRLVNNCKAFGFTSESNRSHWRV